MMCSKGSPDMNEKKRFEVVQCGSCEDEKKEGESDRNYKRGREVMNEVADDE